MDVVRTDRPVTGGRAAVTRDVAAFWDRTSGAWHRIWGPHIHHGFFETRQETPLEAQEKLIERLLALLPVRPGENVLDVGCGMGGSSLYLAQHRGAVVYGITLSARQVAMAKRAATLAGVQGVRFGIDDALALETVADGSMDVVWSLESCEQFHDKGAFIAQAARVLRPGGRLMLATWCCDADEYRGAEARRYRRLCRALQLPYMPTIDRYEALLRAEGLAVHQTCDWSEHVAGTWRIGLERLRAQPLLQVFRWSGWRGLLFGIQAKMMEAAFASGRVRYGVFVATKESAVACADDTAGAV